MDAVTWSEATFGKAALGDKRLRERLVAVGAAMAQHPQQSIPQQMGSWAKTKGCYRLLDHEQVSHAAIQSEHWSQTRQRAEERGVVLVIQDSTYLDYTGKQVADLGLIGDGQGAGLVVHSALAVEATSAEVLGLLHQNVYARQATLANKTTSYQRAKNPHRESLRWEQAVAAIGDAPLQTRWIYVADCEGDCFTFLAACRHFQADYLVRVYVNRRVEMPDETPDHLVDALRQVAAQTEYTITVHPPAPARPREAKVRLGYVPMQVQAPFHTPTLPSLPVTALRVWEPTPPPMTEPVEWLLVTSYPVQTLADALQVVNWYTQRWIIEDYHQCLKTGCRIEQRQFKQAERLQRLMGILGVVAVRLLQFRTHARLHPTDPLPASIDTELIQVVAALAQVAPSQMNNALFWLTIARQGGYLARKHDPPPGWKVIWRGWETIQALWDGVRLSRRLPS